MKNFSFLTHELKQKKRQSGVCCSAKHWKSQTLPCALEAIIRKCLCLQIKIAGLRYMTCSSMKHPLGQVKFVRLFKATVLNLYVIMMKPEIELIISAARLYCSYVF